MALKNLNNKIIYAIMSFGLLFICCKFPIELASPKNESTIVDNSGTVDNDRPISKENEIRNDNSIVKTEKKVIAENIYTGTTAVIIGCCSMAIIFFIAIGLFIKWFRTDNMLNMMTKAIQTSHPKTQIYLKNKIKNIANDSDYCYSPSVPFVYYDNKKCIKDLSKYVRKNKTHV